MALSDESLRRFLTDNLRLELEDVNSATSLFSSGIIDSLGMLDLIVFIETICGIRIGASELTMANLDSIERILTFVASKTRSGTAG